MVRADFLPFLEEAAGHEEPVDVEALGDVAKATSQNIYILLSHFLEGQPLRMTMLVKGRNGPEVWRQLKQKYEPHTGSRAMEALQSFLNYKYENRGYLEDVTAWEATVDAYESSAGERIGDQMKMAILLGRAPAAVREFVLSQGATVATYAEFKRSVVNWVMAQKKWHSTSTSFPNQPSSSICNHPHQTIITIHDRTHAQ